MTASFFWHDYETFGADPVRDRPSQFAGIRTDADFVEIGEPLTLYCQPPPDLLPHPEACLITGITPQLARERGVPEPEFIAAIHQQMSEPNTCSLGYNSLRFDDEVTRHTLYRNFFDPYAREWQNGNSRWDLIDMVRMCRALRPEGIEWPDREDGTPSFRLEHLTAANGISHAEAHDALSDVRATIAMARLIRQQQPKLFAYLFDLRSKHRVAEVLNVAEQRPVLLSSFIFPATRYCTGLVMPLCMHPDNKNAVICADLGVDPQPLLQLGVDELRERLFTPRDQRTAGQAPVGLTTVQLNRCPALAPSTLLDDQVAQRIGLDLVAARGYYQQLRTAGKPLQAKLQQLYQQPPAVTATDPEAMLYSGGFFSDRDRATMAEVRVAREQELADTVLCSRTNVLMSCCSVIVPGISRKPSILKSRLAGKNFAFSALPIPLPVPVL